MLLDRKLGLLFVMFGAITVIVSSCTNSTVTLVDTSLYGNLPAISTLDSIKPTSVVLQMELDVTAPLLENGTTVEDPALAFNAETGHAWAIYQMGPIEGDFMDASATGSGPLWILAADYDSGQWRLMTEFDGGAASIDLSLLGEWLSPAGYSYLAVVCPVGFSGTLDSLTQDYWTISVWDLDISSDDDSITISWSAGMGDSYDIYRSTFSGDSAPYMVGHVVDTGGPRNVFTEQMNIDPDDTTWVPLEHENGTPSDETDDFPTVAPGIDYYYSITPINDIEGEGDPSSELSESILWGTRRATRRILQSSSDGIMVFADQLLPNAMTTAQVQWCVDNLVGTQKVFKWQADEFRDLEPDFVILGYHLGLGAGDIGNVHGDSWDNDADWPYVDAHEDWFLHMPDSTQPGGRVLQQDWDWYGADPVSGWQDYLAVNMLQMLGENHYDGWFIDSTSELWNTDPDPWWPDGTTMFEFWTPRVHSCLQTITQSVADHPLQPYVFVNAGAYITTLSDIDYYGGNWACDGIMVENYGRYNSSEMFAESDWVLECNRILEHQIEGLATIMQCGIWTPDLNDRLFQLGTYYLVKGDYTYINWLGDDGLDTIFIDIGQWYPEWDWDCGPNLGPNPMSMNQMESQGVYRRDFTNGFVVVNPTDSDVSYSIGLGYEYMMPSGGGNIDEFGNPVGSVSWEFVMGASITIPSGAGRIFRSL